MTSHITPRQQSIMDLIKQQGTVQVEALANLLSVTQQTIRRDLNQLYNLQLLNRVHGGAVVKDSVENLGYGARKVLNVRAKIAIGQCAAQLIPNHSSLFINIGTTTERVAEHLFQHKGLLVITNNINVASTLWPAKSLDVMIAGGSIRKDDGGIVGGSTEDFIDNFKVDYAIIGASAISLDGEVLDYDLREVRVAQAIIRRAQSVILVADSMKFDRRASIRIGDFSCIDYLVTDRDVPESMKQLCRANDVHLKIVDVASGDSNRMQ